MEEKSCYSTLIFYTHNKLSQMNKNINNLVPSFKAISFCDVFFSEWRFHFLQMFLDNSTKTPQSYLQQTRERVDSEFNSLHCVSLTWMWWNMTWISKSVRRNTDMLSQINRLCCSVKAIDFQLPEISHSGRRLLFFLFYPT